MVSLVRTNNNDISFIDHMHCTITIHEHQLTLKHCNHLLEIKLSSRQPSVRFYGEQPDGKATTTLCLTRENS